MDYTTVHVPCSSCARENTAATAGTSIQTRRRVAVILRGIKDCHEVRIKIFNVHRTVHR